MFFFFFFNYKSKKRKTTKLQPLQHNKAQVLTDPVSLGGTLLTPSCRSFCSDFYVVCGYFNENLKMKLGKRAADVPYSR